MRNIRLNEIPAFSACCAALAVFDVRLDAFAN